MSASFGAGILSCIATDDPGGDRPNDMAAINAFAATGLSRRFREIVDGRVAEFAFSYGSVTQRWLSNEDAAAVVAVEKKVGGSAPYSSFPGCLENQLYLPNCREEEFGVVELPDSALDEWGFQSIETAVAAAEEWVTYIENGKVESDLDFTKSLLAQLELCQQHDLIFVIDY
jgi:hypothetical protein